MRDSESFADIDRALRQLEESVARFKDEDTKQTLKGINDLRERLYGSISRWSSIELSRHMHRPGSDAFIDGIFSSFMEIHGDRRYGDDVALTGGFAMLGKTPVMVIAHKKHSPGAKDYMKYHYGMASPSGHYKAMRLMRLAEKAHRPVITFVDTPGAYPVPSAEDQGQAFSIAQCISTIAEVKTPVIACIIGEAASGGALSIGFGDRIIMLSNAFYSVISPEGFSSIVYGDASNRKKAADELEGTGVDLFEKGMVDSLVREPTGGAQNDSSGVITETGRVITGYVQELVAMDIKELMEARARRIERLF
ncbi:MAG: carboxyl transferase domain-containing protein [Thermodesulfobacteriota bacterium]|nr:carboxyl transferase domain-containing protein [Thermodesulfobacteriota bacterium]